MGDDDLAHAVLAADREEAAAYAALLPARERHDAAVLARHNAKLALLLSVPCPVCGAGSKTASYRFCQGMNVPGEAHASRVEQTDQLLAEARLAEAGERGRDV